MRKIRFSGEQIIGILKEQQAGVSDVIACGDARRFSSTGEEGQRDTRRFLPLAELRRAQVSYTVMSPCFATESAWPTRYRWRYLVLRVSLAASSLGEFL